MCKNKNKKNNSYSYSCNFTTYPTFTISGIIFPLECTVCIQDQIPLLCLAIQNTTKLIFLLAKIQKGILCN